MIALRVQGRPLRAIAAAVAAKGPRISHEGVAGIAADLRHWLGEQARELRDSIDTSTVVGLRDRALISVMTFAFTRIGAAVAMQVEDYLLPDAQPRSSHPHPRPKGAARARPRRVALTAIPAFAPRTPSPAT